MPKLKTHKGAAKRFKKTGTGKILRGQTKMRHILTSKTQKDQEKLGGTVLVSDADKPQGGANDSLRLIGPHRVHREPFRLPRGSSRVGA